MSKSKVYFIKLNELGKIKDILPELNKPLGVKVHFGEEGNTSFISANLIKFIVEMVDSPVLVETSVLYKSLRRTALGHKQVALKHGFNFAPIDFLDGEEGDDIITVNSGLLKTDNQHFQECYLGKGLSKYESLLVVSHFKGHQAAGFGGAIKNLGMGLAARRGKLAQHASIKHRVKEGVCTACGTCIKHCPVNAIFYNKNKKAEIKQVDCISCSKCISVCPVSAINIPWENTGTRSLQERIAEYARAAVRKRQVYYINFLANIVKDCDCFDYSMKNMTDDIGVLASSDPVAIDQSSYDIVIKQCEAFEPLNGDYQLKHGEKIGLGNRKYELIYL